MRLFATLAALSSDWPLGASHAGAAGEQTKQLLQPVCSIIPNDYDDQI